MFSTRPLEIGFFAFCTLLVLIGGVVTVAAKNPIRGAMGLLVTIVGVAGMYLLLSAELLAAIQVVVYAGAVVVLFLFVIMLLGPDAAEAGDARGAVSRYAGAVVFALAAAGGLFVIMRMGGATLTTLPPASPAMGTIEVIGREMFTKDVVPFEIAGLLLLIAVVGAMTVAKGKQGELLSSAFPKRPRATGETSAEHDGLAAAIAPLSSSTIHASAVKSAHVAKITSTEMGAERGAKP